MADQAPRLKRLVLGLGNPFHGADGFGAAVIARLRQEPAFLDGVDLVDAHTDLLGQIETFARYDSVVLVDAVLYAHGRGEVAVFEEDVFTRWSEQSPGCHEISPLLAVKLFRQLHPEARTDITLVALCTDEIALGLDLPDAAVQAGVDVLGRLLGVDRQLPPCP